MNKFAFYKLGMTRGLDPMIIWLSLNAGSHTYTHIVAHLTLIIIQYIGKFLFAITNFGILLSEFDAMLLLFMANKQILHKNELKEALIALFY